jgi:hypothetical protein
MRWLRAMPNPAIGAKRWKKAMKDLWPDLISKKETFTFSRGWAEIAYYVANLSTVNCQFEAL